MKFYAYIYREPNGTPFYVGKGHGDRAYFHLTRKDDCHLSKKLRKMQMNGETPIIEVIPALDEDHAFFLEECCIAVIGRRDLGTGPLLNLTDGGDGVSGYRWTEEQRAAQRVRLSGITPWNVGVPMSDAQKAKISKAQITRDPQTRLHTQDTKAKISSSLSGKVKTLEHCKAISDAKKGKPGKKNSPETIAKRVESIKEFHRLKKLNGGPK